MASAPPAYVTIRWAQYTRIRSSGFDCSSLTLPALFFAGFCPDCRDIVLSSSSCTSPQYRSRALHHRARIVDPAHSRPHRRLAGLRDQPIDIVSWNKPACSNRQNLGAARRAPGLDLSDLVAIQQHPVTPAPPSERINPSTRFYSQSGPYCLLYCHSEFL